MCSTWRFQSSSIRVLLGKIPCLRPNRGCWFGFFPPILEPWSHRIQNLPGATVTPGPAQPPAPSPSSWIPQFPPHSPPPAAAGWSPQGRTNPCLNPGRNCSAQGLWLQTITHWQFPPGDPCPFSPSLALNPRISFFSPNISCWLFFFNFFSHHHSRRSCTCCCRAKFTFTHQEKAAFLGIPSNTNPDLWSKTYIM